MCTLLERFEAAICRISIIIRLTSWMRLLRCLWIIPSVAKETVGGCRCMYMYMYMYNIRTS